MNELNGYKVSDCVHAIDLYENEIKEVCCYCDEYEHRNITLGDCFGNCDWQESDRQWERHMNRDAWNRRADDGRD